MSETKSLTNFSVNNTFSFKFEYYLDRENCPIQSNNLHLLDKKVCLRRVFLIIYIGQCEVLYLIPFANKQDHYLPFPKKYKYSIFNCKFHL